MASKKNCASFLRELTTVKQDLELSRLRLLLVQADATVHQIAVLIGWSDHQFISYANTRWIYKQVKEICKYVN